MSPRVLCAIALFAITLSGCSSARRGEPFTQRTLAGSPNITRGEHVFFEHCHQCHTGGESALAPALNNKPLPGFMIRLQTRRGLGAMPAFPESKISDDELDDLVAYLKALRKTH
jgi:mono/diheme cytochrome c family protein